MHLELLYNTYNNMVVNKLDGSNSSVYNTRPAAVFDVFVIHISTLDLSLVGGGYYIEFVLSHNYCFCPAPSKFSKFAFSAILVYRINIIFLINHSY